METSKREVESSTSVKGDARKSEAVLQELQRILASRYFRSAGRSRQFLQYVVQQKLEGHLELLKERTIGTEVFQRSPDYATGDDPVVRVQAGEVRRRLEQYYQEVRRAIPRFRSNFRLAPIPRPSTGPPIKALLVQSCPPSRLLSQLLCSQISSRRPVSTPARGQSRQPVFCFSRRSRASRSSIFSAKITKRQYWKSSGVRSLRRSNPF